MGTPPPENTNIRPNVYAQSLISQPLWGKFGFGSEYSLFVDEVRPTMLQMMPSRVDTWEQQHLRPPRGSNVLANPRQWMRTPCCRLNNYLNSFPQDNRCRTFKKSRQMLGYVLLTRYSACDVGSLIKGRHLITFRCAPFDLSQGALVTISRICRSSSPWHTAAGPVW